jgi:hypothetical protein
MAPYAELDASAAATLTVVGRPSRRQPLHNRHLQALLATPTAIAAIAVLLLPYAMAGTQVATLDTGLTVTLHYEAKEDVLVHW